MSRFQYDPDILAAFPEINGGIIVGRGLRNGPSQEALQQRYIAEQRAVLQRIGDTPLSELESLAAWRAAFRRFGVDPTQYRSAAEALLRRLTKKGDIPSINILVDLGNLVSIRYGLPVAVLDTRAIALPITVHFADGSERFVNLGQAEAEIPPPGEVIFSDTNKQVVARRWCWRQSDQSGAKDDTPDVLITIEAHHARGREDVQAAMEDLLALLSEFTGGEFESALLNRDNPAF
jgi:DNA/RNA-binding domain of Phe-tRNA-synthetase-like protein